MHGHGIIGNHNASADVVLVQDLAKTPNLALATFAKELREGIVGQLVRSDHEIEVLSIPSTIRHDTRR
jgi:hypothetical protein